MTNVSAWMSPSARMPVSCPNISETRRSGVSDSRLRKPLSMSLATFVPALFADREDPWAAINSSPASLAPALELWTADVEERGLGELPFPPDYPKMPGEPKRVQPSKARDDTEGLETENLYADPARWVGKDPDEVSRQRRAPRKKA